MKIKHRSLKILFLLSLFILFSACGKKNKSSDDDETIGGLNTDNPLAQAYPGSLVLSVFPTDVASAGLVEDTVSEEQKSIKTKMQETERYMNGQVDNCLDLSWLLSKTEQINDETCYEFDNDMNPAKYGTREYGTRDGKSKLGTGEACMVSFARKEINLSIGLVDKALSLIKGLMCQAKKENQAKELQNGEELSLAQTFQKAISSTNLISNLNITTASIKKQDDGNTYLTNLNFDIDKTVYVEVTLLHTKLDNDQYKGILTFKRYPLKEMPTGAAAMSINYRRLLENNQYKSKYEVRKAHVDYETVKPIFDEKNMLNYAKIPENAVNNISNAHYYAIFDINPDTSEGNIAYWRNPGGRYDESARGFVFKVESKDNILQGCGISGATKDVSIRKAITNQIELKPARFWHPFSNENESPYHDTRYGAKSVTEDTKITKQCFNYNKDTKVYEIDRSTYQNDPDQRGYDVIDVSKNDILPPEPPKD